MITVDEIFTFENLYHAYLYTKRGKCDKECVARYSFHALEATNYLMTYLQRRVYRISDYYKFKVYVPKEREIMAPPFRDRVVQRCLCEQVLMPVIEKHLIYDTYACRVNKGTHAGLERTEFFFKKYYRKNGLDGWIIKGDISKYFYSIDHKILKKDLQPLLKNYDVWWLVENIIDSAEPDGIPLGNQSSQWFANFYLSKFDHFAKEKLGIKHYIRYMDDWVCLVETREEAKEYLQAMKDFLWDELKLKTNSKTQILPIKNGVDFLGFNIRLTKSGKVIRKIRVKSKQAMKRKLKAFKKKYDEGTMTKEAIEHSYKSWVGHASHGNCYGLIKQMDALYDEIFKESRDVDGTVIK